MLERACSLVRVKTIEPSIEAVVALRRSSGRIRDIRLGWRTPAGVEKRSQDAAPNDGGVRRAKAREVARLLCTSSENLVAHLDERGDSIDRYIDRVPALRVGSCSQRVNVIGHDSHTTIGSGLRGRVVVPPVRDR